MKEQEEKIKHILVDLEKEFTRLDPVVQARFAKEQINKWQIWLNKLKDEIPEEDVGFEFGRINLRFL